MSAPSVATPRGSSVQVVRQMAQLLPDDSQRCECPVPPERANGVCNVDAMRITAADYTSGRRLL